jgi:molybdopterin-binding protein
MKISARNSLKGTVKTVEIGAVNATVTIEVAPGVEVVAMITKASAETIGLKAGDEAYAVIKASDVMVAVDQG